MVACGSLGRPPPEPPPIPAGAAGFFLPNKLPSMVVFVVVSLCLFVVVCGCVVVWCVICDVCCPRNNFFFNALVFVLYSTGRQHPLPERHDLGMAFSSAWHRAEGFTRTTWDVWNCAR